MQNVLQNMGPLVGLVGLVCLWFVSVVGVVSVARAQSTSKPPVFLNQPPRVIVEGKLWRERIDLGGPGWRAEKVTFTLRKGPSKIQLTSLGQRGCCRWWALLTWIPEQKDVGKHNIEIEATDDAGKSFRQVFTLKVLNRNDAPQIRSVPPVQAKEGVVYLYRVQAIDPDSNKEVLAYRLLSAPTGMSIGAKGQIRWLPTSEQVGPHEVSLEVSDSSGATTRQAFVVTVQNVEQTPRFVSRPLLGAVVGQPYLYQLRAQDSDVGDRLVFRLNSKITGMKLSSSGLISWLPSRAGRFTLSADVADLTGRQANQQWTITVVQQNKVPTILSHPPASILQGQTYRYTLQVKDDEKDVLSFVLIEAPSGMLLTTQGLKSTAELTWTPKASEVGVHSVLVRVDDQKGGVVWERFQIRVLDVNDPPQITSLPRKKILQGKLYRYHVQATEPDGEPVRFALNQAPAGMQIDPATGVVSWRPVSQTTVKVHTVVVVATDPQGALAKQKYQVEVLDSNDRPQWTSQPVLQAVQDKLYTYQAKVVDADAFNDEVRFRLVEHPMGMQVDRTSGLIRWIPGALNVGKHQVVIEALDTQGGVAQQSFVLTVKDENDAPVVISKPVRTAQAGRLYLYRIRVTDKDSPTSGNTITFALQGPTGMKLEQQEVRTLAQRGHTDLLGAAPSLRSLQASAVLSWTPNVLDASRGEIPVQVQVSDGQGGIVVHKFNVRVLDVANKFPQVKEPKQVTVEEGKLFRSKVEASDPDKDTLVFELIDGPEGLVLDAKTHELRWTPRLRHVGTWRVEVRVDDQRGGVVWWSLRLKVKPRKHAPQIVSIPQTDAMAGIRYLYALRGVAPSTKHRGLLRWKLKQGPSGMVLDAQRGVLFWSPGEKDVGGHLVQVELNDPSGGGVGLQRFTLQVRSRNQGPQITSSAPKGTVQEGELFSYTVAVLDPNPSDSLRFRLLQAPLGMTIGMYSGLVKWTPSAKQVGKHSIRLEVRDALGAAAQQKFSLKVEDLNEAPRILSLPMLGAVVGKLYRYELVIKDSENDSIQSIVLLEQPIALKAANQMKLDRKKQELTWVPGTEHQNGYFLVVLKVTDKRGASTQQSFVIRVGNTNKTPTWKKSPPTGKVVLSEKQLYTLALQAEDVDGDRLTFYLLKAPKGMVVQPRSGKLSWVPSAAQVGTHTVVLAVRDGRGGELRAQWSFLVTNQNDAPRIVSKPSSFARTGQLYQYQVAVVDPDAQDTLQFTLQQAPKGMRVNVTKGLISWTPRSVDVARSYLVVVRVVDQRGAFDSQVFHVNVAAVNRAPQIISSPLQQASEGRLYSYLVRASDPDRADTLEYSLRAGPRGMLINSQTGWLRWMPGNQDVGRAEVTVQVRDSLGATHSQTFTIAVSNRNNPPRFLSSPCAQASVNTAYQCVLVVEDVDPNTQSLYIESLRVPERWKAQISSSSSSPSQPHSVFLVVLSWDPQPQDIGTHLIELRVSDGVASDRLIYSLNVGSNEEVPIAIPGENQHIAPGEVLLDGRKSRDAKGVSDGLSYEWRLVQGPQEVKLENPKRSQIKMILRKSGSYLFSLVVSKEGRSSAPGFVRVTIKNLKPSAHLWAPSGAHVGQAISLDGRASADANNDGLKYRWQLSINNKLQSDWRASTSSVQFTPKRPGLYRFTLTTSEDLPSFQRSGSSTAAVEVVVHDPSRDIFLPHPVILAPKSGNVGQSLVLDGSRSLALSNGGKLSYQWRMIEGPQKAQLTTPNREQTSFVAVNPGYYRIGLVVRQKTYFSREAVWGLSIQGNSEATQMPVARVLSSYGVLETWFKFDASQSTGPGGAQLQFFWKQKNGAATVLRDPKASQPSFFVLHPSPYEFQLRVQGKGPQSAPVRVSILVNKPDNKPPVADAGPAMFGTSSRTAGQLVELDGSKSRDPDGTREKLVYRWKQVAGFPVALNTDKASKASFVPLTYGILRFSLEVFDGVAWSYPSYVNVVVNSEKNKVPHADAGPDQMVRLGQSVTLDSSKSYDLDSEDKLVFQWRLLEPVGQPISLNLTDPIHPSFTAKHSGVTRYVFGLRVDDGKSRSLEDTVVIRVIGTNQPPIAQIQVSGNAVVGEEFLLDGSSSQDPDNDKLTYTWKQLTGPPLELGDLEKSRLAIKASKAATYRFQLQVHDGLARSAPVSIVVQIKEPKPEPKGCGCQTDLSSPRVSLCWLLLWSGFFFLWIMRRKLEGTT